jgi:hypothetical protein
MDTVLALTLRKAMEGSLLEYPVSRPGFEPTTSRIQFQSVTAVTSFLVLCTLLVGCRSNGTSRYKNMSSIYLMQFDSYEQTIVLRYLQK